MLISIVVPVYNVEKYLEQCVMSFINQIDDMVLCQDLVQVKMSFSSS